MTASTDSGWQTLLTAFFGSSNRLDWPSDVPALTALMVQNEVSLSQEQPGAVILPYVSHDSRTLYVAIARDDDTAFDLRRVLSSTVGTTYAGPVRGIDVESEAIDTPLQAARLFAGADRRVSVIPVVGGDPAKRAVRDQVTRTMALLNQRPARRFAEVRPFGRLLRDFNFALDRGDEDWAQNLLFAEIVPEGRLSGLNRHFLQIRFLAAFEKWDELEAFPYLEDLLRTTRPALVSDALAKFALARATEALGDDWVSWITTFEREIVGRFGNLVPSADAIRSPEGAFYYILWATVSGDDPKSIQTRLEGSAWLENEAVLGLLAGGSSEPVEGFDVDENVVREACEAGLFDRVVELLATAEPASIYVPFVVRALAATLSLEAARLLARYREALGDDVFENLKNDGSLATSAEELVGLSWAGWLEAEAGGRLNAEVASTAPTEVSIADLLTDPAEVDRVVAVLRGSYDAEATARLLDAALTLLRRLEESSPEDRMLELNPVRAAVIDLWAISDTSGDKTRAGEVLDQLHSLLDSGCSIERYAELIEYFDAAWGPFNSDTAFGLTVQLVDLLAAARPHGDELLVSFAQSVFARLGPDNVRRLDRTDVEIADSISTELGLGLRLKEWAQTSAGGGHRRPAWTGAIGLYSLDAGALLRAKQVLAQVLPGATVETSSDKVATASLKALAQRADVMVVAWKVAKHPAGGAIKAARAGRPVGYASGKGSSSLVREVLGAIERSQDAAA